MKHKVESCGLIVLAFGFVAAPAHATFHLMQVEQVIAGVNGDVTAQAIQLRMRLSFQNMTSEARIRAWDAMGANPVLIIDMARDVTNFQAGDRVLIVSTNFVHATDPPVVADFVMASLIPQSYLAAGSLTFESDLGQIYWRLSWGGNAYTGATTGLTDNDNDAGSPGSPANFGPPFTGALPSTTLQALQFTGGASALSTTNAADYAITTVAAVFTNNARDTFPVVPIPVVGDIDGDSDVDMADYALCVACMAGPDGTHPDECTPEEFADCDLHEDSSVDLADIAAMDLLVSNP